MSIKTKLVLLSAIPLVGLMLGMVMIFFMVRHTNQQIDVTQKQYATEIELARRMQYDVIQIQQFLTDFSATRGQDGLDDGIKEAEKFRADFLECVQQYTTLADTIHETNDLNVLTAISSEFGNYWENGLKMANVYAKEGTTAGNKFMPIFDKAADGLTAKLEPFVKVQKQQFDDALNSVQISNSRVANLLITGGLVLLIGALSFCIWVGRSISSSVLRSVVSMHSNVVLTSSVARRISESSGALADGANTQAASVEETSSSLEEISSMTKRNSEDAQKANGLAKETRVVAERGAKDMHEMNKAMETIKVSSDEISEIIKTIDEIAFQTNILALNAAVEAARAGTAGMGFAVVADEVRNLAQRSAEAAKETATKIEGAISNTARGVELSGKVAQTFDDIVTKARELDELAAELANASGEQAQGIAQINEAVFQVDKVTQGNAGSAQENATAAKDLMYQTTVLKDAIEHLMNFLGENSSDGAFLKSKGKGVIQWNEKEMATSVSSIDEQHRELIKLINSVHETVQKGKGGDQLMRELKYLGEYAQNHFAHEEGIMDSHRCPIAGKNKEAHGKFLRQYQDLVQDAHTNGPTPQLAVSVQKMLGEWLSSHICKIDTNLRGCHPHKPLATAGRRR